MSTPSDPNGKGREQEESADTKRLDWLEQKFALANQAAIISKSSDGRPEYKCSSGFHCGDSIREAIDAAMEASKTSER